MGWSFDSPPGLTRLMTESNNRRFKDRHLRLPDLVYRFEAAPTSTHVRSALGLIERLKDEGSRRWNPDSKQLNRWRDYCDVLWRFINSELGTRRFLEQQDLSTALREFISEFEHSTHGMFEMLYGTSDNPDTDEEIQRLLSWFEMLFRFSIYAMGIM